MSRVKTRGVLPQQYESLHLGIALYDPQSGELLDGNEHLSSLFGYKVSQLRELPVTDYSANTFAFSQRELRQRIRQAASGAPQEFKWRIKRAGGKLVWVRVTLSQVRFDGHQYVLGELQNVDEEHHNSRQVSLLSRVIRHNLRNDLTVITGYASQISADSDRGDMITYAEKIHDHANGIAAIPESVKQIERAVSTTAGTPSRRNVTDVVASVVDRIQTAYPTAEIQISERAEMWADVDEALEYALEHAFENAVVHSDSTIPSVTVTIGTSPNTNRLEIRIVDECPPIPEDEIEAIDSRSETTAIDHGSGVGLFVMKWCLESLGGELVIDTIENGNVVHFLLPPKSPPTNG